MINKNLENAIVAKQGDLLYTTLAEECTELAQACCKINRKKFLKEDFSKSLENFFEEICDVQINLQCIKQQIMKETGMSEIEYDQYINTWTKFKEDKLMDVFVGRSMEDSYKKLKDAEYIAENCEPIKCTYCGSKDLRDDNFYKEDWYVVEHDKICNRCGKKLGHWAYGSWTDF